MNRPQAGGAQGTGNRQPGQGAGQGGNRGNRPARQP